jgi:polyferredoxin
LRITRVRVIVQAVVFAMFISFVLLTTFSWLDRFPGLKHWIDKLIEIDPLIAIANALTTHTIYKGLLWALVLLVPTFFLGRFFCNWICPFGTLHQFTGWAFRRPDAAEAIEANRYKRSQHIKYYVLAAFLVMALLGSLQVGLLDPMALFYRSMTDAVIPAARMPFGGDAGGDRFYQGAWLVGLLLFVVVVLNLAYPRFFCRVLCPLGALLGVFSRFAWWRVERDPDKCTDCEQCLARCEAASDPHKHLRMSECFVCMNCVEDCPEGALRFAWLPGKERAVAETDVSGRRVVLASVAGLLFVPFVRAAGRSSRDFSSDLIRPPGAVEELEFLERCIKCDQCIRVCPTNVLQPAWFEGGLEGLWSPVVNFRMGHCQYHCTACGQVCPTGAIQPLSIERKLGIGEHASDGPVRLGTAHVDPGRCLPLSKGVPCAVCEEVCPTSPKAIYTEEIVRTSRDGSTRERIKAPRVDIDKCIGCGICENACPIPGDRRAIYVTADGESRSEHHPDPDRSRTARVGR